MQIFKEIVLREISEDKRLLYSQGPEIDITKIEIYAYEAAK